MLLDSELPPGPGITAVEAIPARRSAIDLGVLNGNLPELGAHHERVVLRERDGVALTAEIYVPVGEGPFPVMVYLHGGAFCVWSAADVRRCAAMIAASGHVVVNVDYGLAPEHPFPWAVEDAVYAVRWSSLNAERYGGEQGAIRVGGDSSGANLAAAAIVFLSGHEAEIDEGNLEGVEVSFGGALLFCGIFEFPSRLAQLPTTPGTTEVMSNLAYLGTTFLARHCDPLVSPIYAPDLSCFPPTYLSCGDRDATLPQSLDMVQALVNAQVPTTQSVVAGGDHEFLLMYPPPPFVQAEWQRIDDWLGGL